MEEDFEDHDEEELAKAEKTDKVNEKLPDLFEGGTMRGYQMEGFQWLVVWSILAWTVGFH